MKHGARIGDGGTEVISVEDTTEIKDKTEIADAGSAFIGDAGTQFIDGGTTF